MDHESAKGKAFRHHATVLSLASGCFYGFNLGIVSGLSDSLVRCHYFPEEQRTTEMNSQQSTMKGLFTACILFGGIAGSVLGVPLADRFGRKACYVFMAAIGCLSGLQFVVDSFPLLIVIRTLLGIPVGGVSVLVPIYITETCSAETRGSMGTIFQIAICFSILLAQITNYIFDTDYNPDVVDKMCVETWKEKVQLGVGILPAAVMLLHAVGGFLESEEWLKQSSNTTQESLLSNPTDATGEVSEGRATQGKIMGWSELFGTKTGLYWTFIGTGLGCCSQLTGINAIMFYSPHIFKEAGLPNVLVFTIFAVGTWNLMTVFIANRLVDKLGQKPLMLAGLSGMGISSLLLSLSYGVLKSVSHGLFSVMTILSVMGFVLSFEVGPGALFFLLAAESFPAHVRPKGLVYSNVMSWIFNIIVSFCFPVLENSLGPSITFAFFVVSGFGCFMFVAYALPNPASRALSNPSVEPDLH